jgi:ATP-dependent Clp protease ATP-binding subunit ClpA
LICLPRYINDRKLPDKAIDVIDEAAAAQNLLPPSRRRQTIGQKEIEATVANNGADSVKAC